MKIFSERLIQSRKDKNLTQIQLANYLHLDKSTIAKYETNEIEPTLQILIALADILDVETDYLLGRKDF